MDSHKHPKELSDPQAQVSESIAHQQEPLIINNDVEAAARASQKKVSYMSLPKKGQLALLCIARLADPLAATSIQVCENLCSIHESGVKRGRERGIELS